MKQVNDEVIDFLSDMALRKKTVIDIEDLSIYVALMNHFCNRRKMNLSQLSTIVRHINEKAFDGYPELKESFKAVKNLVELTEVKNK